MPKQTAQKTLNHLYRASAREPNLVRVPALNYLMADGTGGPQGTDFRDVIAALYSICYTMKFMYGKGHPIRDARVQALEGLYSIEDGGEFRPENADKMRWTLMVMQPAPITRTAISAACRKLKENNLQPGPDRVRFARFNEGLCVQVLHIGPYDREKPTLECLQAWAREQGYELHGRHHEIYLSDPNRTAPAKLKTILRFPVRRAKR